MDQRKDEEILKAIDGALGDDHSLNKRVRQLEDGLDNYVIKQDFLKTVKNLKRAVRNKTKPIVNLDPIKRRVDFLADQIPAPYDDTGISEGLEELREKVDTPIIPITHSSLLDVLPDQHHNAYHPIHSHDTNATGLQLNTLTDGSNADSLHTHKLEEKVIVREGGGTIWKKYILTVGGRAKNTGDKTIYIKGANEVPADTTVTFTNPDAGFITNITTDGLITGSSGLSDGTVTLSSGVFNIFPLTPSSAPSNNYDVANKKYVDDQVSGVNEFTELTDTPANYTGQGLKGVRVNVGATALEFYTTVTDTDEKVAVDSTATAGYLGAVSSDGVLRTGSPFTYTDGGDYVTLGLDETAVDHSNLSNLSYATAGHTGFEPTLTKGNMTATSPIIVDQTRQVIGGAVVVSHATTAGNIHLPTGGSANQILKNSGTSGTGGWGTVTENAGALAAVTTISMSGQLTNTLAFGTSPFAVTSTTVNTNLNADMTDGYHLDQDVTSGAAPTFTADNLSDGGGNIIPTSTQETNWDATYGKRVDTWGDGLTYTTQTASVDYNTTNLKITTNQLDTIQGISSGASPTFAGLTVNGDIETTSTNAFYFGDTTTAGSWRIIRDGSDLAFERYESAAWVEKGRMMAA